MRVFNTILLVLMIGEAVFADFAETVGQFIKQLDSPTLAERDAAQQKLLELGPGIEKLLPDEDEEEGENVSPETKVRLKNLRRDFLIQSIDQSLDNVRFTLESFSLQETQHEPQNQAVARIKVDWSDSAGIIQPIRWRFPLDFIGQNGVYDIPAAPWQTQAMIRFSWKTTAEDPMNSLHGKCNLLFAAGVRTFILPLGKETGNIVRRENAVVSLLGTVYDQRTRQLKIRFQVEYDNALDTMQSHLIWIESNPASLEGENGQTILPDGPVQQLEKAENRFVGILSFRIPRETPWKTFRFVYQTPTILAEKTMDLPLTP